MVNIAKKSYRTRNYALLTKKYLRVYSLLFTIVLLLENNLSSSSDNYCVSCLFLIPTENIFNLFQVMLVFILC
jgi:hypothetical protein